MKEIIPEKRYRASMICRALGNPTAYEVLTLLGEKKMTPDELARSLGVSVATVSQVLRVLRNLDRVKYEVNWRQRLYRVKSHVVQRVMQDLERLVSHIVSEA
ncbi:winged helix-turn-helix transcriptional regulator [candidate division WOR-3 bacterium]|nr:winged helix-turn-helix transcriptional regulator [candidate division WOR-3 bacterium]